MMRRGPTLVLALLAAALCGRAGTAKGPEIYPLSKVSIGQKGYGLTVLQGTRPERFEFEVVGVARKMLPKMDIIIFKSDDPKLQLTGVARGMSGSPLYIDGKIACALAYAWSFNKIAMGGCTPIEYMIAESRHPWRKDPERLAQVATEEWHRHKPIEKFLEPVGAGAERDWFARTPLPARQPEPPRDQGLVRASLPLVVSGLGPTAFEQARQAFAPYHIEPMQGAGGGGDLGRGPTTFELGGNIAVKLAEGDMSSAVTCAVSYLDGSRVLGCGHPMFTLGEVSMPAAVAEIHTIVPSMQSAFKLASPLRELGALVQDRKTAIVADTSRTAQMVPVDIKIKTAAGEQEFHSRVVDHKFLTPQLTTIALASAIELLTPDIADATVTVRSAVHVRGHDPLYFTDYLYSAEGLSLAALATSRGLRVLVPLLFNPFEPVRLERISLEAHLTYKADHAEIVAVRVPELELPVEKETWIDVDLRPYDMRSGRFRTVRIPFTVPRHLAGALVKIEVLPGDQAKPDSGAPENLAQVLDVLRHKTFPANVLVATMYTPTEGVTMRGRILPDLPDSALDAARPATATKRADAYRSILRSTVPLKQVATGKQELVVKIAALD
jgi:hypothetical protein